MMPRSRSRSQSCFRPGSLQPSATGSVLRSAEKEVDYLFWPGQTTEITVDDDPVEAVVYQGEQISEKLGEEIHRVYCTQDEESVGRKTIKRGPGKRHIDGKDFQLADEIRYIQRRAAEHDGRFVTVGSLALFSTDTGDAWLLDPGDHLAARLARDGDPEDVYFEETDTRFAIGWQGEYRIDGNAFIYIDRDSGRVITILGYPVQHIAEWS